MKKDLAGVRHMIRQLKKLCKLCPKSKAYPEQLSLLQQEEADLASKIGR